MNQTIERVEIREKGFVRSVFERFSFTWRLVWALLRLEWEGLLLRLALRRKGVFDEIAKMKAEDCAIDCCHDREVAERVLIDLRRGGFRKTELRQQPPH